MDFVSLAKTISDESSLMELDQNVQRIFSVCFVKTRQPYIVKSTKL